MPYECITLKRNSDAGFAALGTDRSTFCEFMIMKLDDRELVSSLQPDVMKWAQKMIENQSYEDFGLSRENPILDAIVSANAEGKLARVCEEEFLVAFYSNQLCYNSKLSLGLGGLKAYAYSREQTIKVFRADQEGQQTIAVYETCFEYGKPTCVPINVLITGDNPHFDLLVDPSQQQPDYIQRFLEISKKALEQHAEPTKRTDFLLKQLAIFKEVMKGIMQQETNLLGFRDRINAIIFHRNWVISRVITEAKNLDLPSDIQQKNRNYANYCDKIAVFPPGPQLPSQCQATIKYFQNAQTSSADVTQVLQDLCRELVMHKASNLLQELLTHRYGITHFVEHFVTGLSEYFQWEEGDVLTMLRNIFDKRPSTEEEALDYLYNLLTVLDDECMPLIAPLLTQLAQREPRFQVLEAETISRRDTHHNALSELLRDAALHFHQKAAILSQRYCNVVQSQSEGTVADNTTNAAQLDQDITNIRTDIVLTIKEFIIRDLNLNELNREALEALKHHPILNLQMSQQTLPTEKKLPDHHSAQSRLSFWRTQESDNSQTVTKEENTYVNA